MGLEVVVIGVRWIVEGAAIVGFCVLGIEIVEVVYEEFERLFIVFFVESFFLWSSWESIEDLD